MAGGFWSIGGAAAVRTLVGQRFAPRLAAYPGATLILNGEPLQLSTIDTSASSTRADLLLGSTR